MPSSQKQPRKKIRLSSDPVEDDDEPSTSAADEMSESDDGEAARAVASTSARRIEADSSESESDEGEAAAVASTLARKIDLDSSDEDDEDQDVANLLTQNHKVKFEQAILERDTDGYVAGSIVRVATHNFLVHENIEIRPGPYLNLIIGANGSGKSTLSCAIALGLGFAPEILGRRLLNGAKVTVRNFVREDGPEKGWCEVEVKGRKGQRNTVIRRNIQKSNDGSTYQMDGRNATLQEVQARVASFHIQPDNMVTFLAQDKIKDFPKMSDAARLTALQRAAGMGGLIKYQQQLIAWGAEEKKRKLKDEDDLKELDALKHANGRVQKQVEALETRAAHEREIRILNCLLKFAEYSELRKEATAAKEEKIRLAAELKAIDQKHKPIKDTLSLLKDEANRFGKEAKASSKEASKTLKDIEQIVEQLKAKEEVVAEIRRQRTNLFQQSKSRQQTIDSLDKSIRALENETSDPPPDADASGLNGKIASKERDKAEINLAVAARKADADQAERDVKEHTRTVSRLTERIDAAKVATSHRDRDFQAYKPALFQVVVWLREAKAAGKLVGNVYEPARLSCDVQSKYRHLAAVAEAAIASASQTFLFEEKADYELFMDANAGRKVTVGRAQIVVRPTAVVIGRGVETSRRFSEQQLKDWGFNILAIDLIKGPPAVMAFLAMQASLSSFPVAFDKGAIKREVVEASAHRPPRYFDPEQSTTIYNSRYGSGRGTTVTTAITKPHYLGKSGDSELVASLSEERRKAQALVEDATGLLDGFRKAHVEEKTVLSGVLKDLESLNKNKQELQKPRAAYLSKVATLKAKRQQREKVLREPSQADKKRDLTRKLSEQINRQHDLVMKRHVLADIVTKAALSSVEANLRQTQAEADALALRESLEECAGERDAKHDELVEADKLAKARKEKAEDASTVASNLLAELEDDPDDHEAATAGIAKDLDIEHLETRLAEEEAKLQASSDISPDVLVKFKKRSEEIARLQVDYDKEHDKLLKLRQDILDMKNKWLPPLQELVDVVNKAFSKTIKEMNRAGEVRLYQPEDLEKWGLEIWVAFRQGEDLHPLNGMRQSGGEKALTTLLFMMSLVTIAKAPFALADEINQGLDPKAEREAYGHFFKMAGDSLSGQNFLLTPKLLHELEYHERIKVLTVCNWIDLPRTITIKSTIASRRATNATRLAQAA